MPISRQKRSAQYPPPEGKNGLVELNGQASRHSQDRRAGEGYSPSVVGGVAAFLSRYIILPRTTLLVVATWVVASWMKDIWDRFPHLAITSPEKRCGKTRLMQLIECVTLNPINTTNISPAAIFRLIAASDPTLLLDEAQSVARRGSESSEIVRELLNAAIDRNAKVIRVGGKGNDQIKVFPCYCPKVVALIGQLDEVLADRCLPVAMTRKTNADKVEKYRSRLVDPVAELIRELLKTWTSSNREDVKQIYDQLEPFNISNDRLAELLLPLQAVLSAACPDELATLQGYAEQLQQAEKAAERQSPGVQLLTACKEIFSKVKADKDSVKFLATSELIIRLVQRDEEPWDHFTRGRTITPENLASLLRPYGIRSDRNKAQTSRGYFAHAFEDAWGKYTSDKPA